MVVFRFWEPKASVRFTPLGKLLMAYGTAWSGRRTVNPENSEGIVTPIGRQIFLNYMLLWWNRRHAGLRNQYLMVYQFNSDQEYQNFCPCMYSNPYVMIIYTKSDDHKPDVCSKPIMIGSASSLDTISGG